MSQTSHLKPCLALIHVHYARLHDAEIRVADYVLSDPGKVLNISAATLAELTTTSVGTVVRFCQKLGFSGYRDFKVMLAASLLNFEDEGGPSDHAQGRDRISESDSAQIIFEKIFRRGMHSLSATLQLLQGQNLEQIVDAIVEADRIELYTAGGISIPFALMYQYRFLVLGIKAAAYSIPEAQDQSAHLLSPNDMAIGIAHYGSAGTVDRALRLAHQSGAVTLAITNTVDSPLAHTADMTLFTAAPPSVQFSEPAGARIPLLAILDALYAAVAMRLERMTEPGRRLSYQ